MKPSVFLSALSASVVFFLFLQSGLLLGQFLQHLLLHRFAERHVLEEIHGEAGPAAGDIT
jgi:hypothetical protein